MRILYVCTGNSFRSTIAEALTRRYCPEMEVESAGTRPADKVAEKAERLLGEDNAVDYLKEKPDKVSQRAVEEADIIICMRDRHYRVLEGRYAPENETRIWRIDDPIRPDIDPEEAYRRIKEKVKQL